MVAMTRPKTKGYTMQSNNINISTSFIQDQKHATKSERFVQIVPSDIGMRLADQGFELVKLQSGQARKQENIGHQTTIARYRQNNELTIGGHFLDVVFKVPHLTGSVQAFLGTYRQVCSNGLVVGQKFFEAPRIRHTGDALDQIEGLVAGLVSKHDQLIEFIKELQSRDVSPQGLSEFLERAVALRLENSENVQNVQYSDLLTVRREADTNKDAYTIYNVVEENINRHGFRYQVKNTDENGIVNIRNMVARPLGYRRGQDVETSRSVDYKSELTDIAYEFLKAA